MLTVQKPRPTCCCLRRRARELAWRPKPLLSSCSTLCSWHRVSGSTVPWEHLHACSSGVGSRSRLPPPRGIALLRPAACVSPRRPLGSRLAVLGSARARASSWLSVPTTRLGPLVRARLALLPACSPAARGRSDCCSVCCCGCRAQLLPMASQAGRRLPPCLFHGVLVLCVCYGSSKEQCRQPTRCSTGALACRCSAAATTAWSQQRAVSVA